MQLHETDVGVSEHTVETVISQTTVSAVSVLV